MTALDAAGALSVLDLAGTGLAVAGSVAGTRALVMYIKTIRGARRFREHAAEEQSQNMLSLKGTLSGCRETIATVLSIDDREDYFRSLGALSLTLQGALSRYEAYVGHGARESVQTLTMLLLDASTSGRPESHRCLRMASAHIDLMLAEVRPPPADPRPGG